MALQQAVVTALGARWELEGDGSQTVEVRPRATSLVPEFRMVEEELLDVLGETGVGCIAFSPLAQGMLTSKYLGGIPEGSRASRESSLSPDLLSDKNLEHVRALNAMAQERGQTLAQMALAWALRDERVTSVIVGASSVAQLDDNLGALEKLHFDDAELARIDEHAVDAGINLWARSGEA